MKKVLAILLCLILVLGMAACASTNPATENKTEAEPATTAENTPTPARGNHTRRTDKAGRACST